jgi:predicted Ser/Thr protein kinase
MPVTERLPGTLGPYRLQDRLGEGGMGVVHLALDPAGQLVAVKVLRALGAEGLTARRRLAREVDTMRRVRSPFVAEVLDADVTGEFPYIVTRYVAGPTLEQLVRTHGPLSREGLRRLAYGTAEALAAIHVAGVVHRDLKPGNVMLTDDRPIVIDFGIAQLGDATRLTQTGLVMGTPGYLAPEVIEGQPSSPASDVHSWGATMAFAATGRAPFGGGTYETIFYRIVSGRADLEGVPTPLVPLISSALAREPGHRPQAAWLSDQAKALDLAAAPVYHPPPQPPTMARPAPRFEARPPTSPKQAAQDVAELLPPVPYVPVKPAARAPEEDQGRPAPRPNATVGLAIMVAAVALTVMLPIAGLVTSLAVITLLRAADRSQKTLASRRSLRGPRASDLLLVLIMSPLTVARAVLTEVLLAPLALAAGAAAYAATIVVTHSMSLPKAGAYAAAAIVACYGLGPGSGRPRRQLNRMAGAIARTGPAAAVTVFGCWALAIAVVTVAASQTPYYWPMMAPHLPGLHSMVSTAAHWLIQHTRIP